MEVLRPVRDMSAEPRVPGLINSDDPSAENEGRQEGKEEHLSGQAWPAPLRPTSEQLAERQDEAGQRHEPDISPVAVPMENVGTDVNPAPEPHQETCKDNTDERHS